MLKKIYLVLSVLPPLLLIGVYLWLQTLEGWGQWGAAGLLILPVILSVVLGIWGIVITLLYKHRGAKVKVLIALVLISLVPFFWFIYMWLSGKLR